MGELSRARPILLASRRSVSDVYCSLGYSLDGYSNFQRSGGQWVMRRMSFVLAEWAAFSCISLDQLAILEPSPKGFGESLKCPSARRIEHILHLLLLALLGLPQSKLSSKHGVAQQGAPSRCICSHARYETPSLASIHAKQSPFL
uniref:Uncharacterized protein n=1 Tax=Solanum tuberosum TaxID=4113 RepID=M1DTU4_SOLTU